MTTQQVQKEINFATAAIHAACVAAETSYFCSEWAFEVQRKYRRAVPEGIIDQRILNQLLSFKKMAVHVEKLKQAIEHKYPEIHSAVTSCTMNVSNMILSSIKVKPADAAKFAQMVDDLAWSFFAVQKPDDADRFDFYEHLKANGWQFDGAFYTNGGRLKIAELEGGKIAVRDGGEVVFKGKEPKTMLDAEMLFNML